MEVHAQPRAGRRLPTRFHAPADRPGVGRADGVAQRDSRYPASAASRTIAVTAASGTSPSNGSPKATEMVSDSLGALGRPALAAAISRMTRSWSCTGMPWLRTPKPSDALTTAFTSLQPAATARSQPRRFSASPMRERPGRGAGRP
jgi:hypothetical protein